MSEYLIDPIILTLKSLRKKTRQPLAVLAPKLGVCTSTLSSYEIGKRTPPADKLAAWASLLGARLTLAVAGDDIVAAAWGATHKPDTPAPEEPMCTGHTFPPMSSP